MHRMVNLRLVLGEKFSISRENKKNKYVKVLYSKVYQLPKEILRNNRFIRDGKHLEIVRRSEKPFNVRLL